MCIFFNINRNVFSLLNRMCLRFVIFLLLISIGGVAFAEEKIVTGKFVVSFTAKANQKAWIVNALEQNIYNDLSGYGRIVPVNKVTDENKRCKHRSVQCAYYAEDDRSKRFNVTVG